MSLRHSRIPVLPLVACVLICVASGDDFCLPRLLLPATPAAESELPLDDPNTDFVEANDLSSARHGRCRRECDVPSFPQGGRPAPACCFSVPHGPCASRRASLGDLLNPPLRC